MTTRLFVYILFLVFVPVTVCTAEAQDEVQNISLLKAVFIYNFAKFTRWPEGQPGGPQNQIILCAIGRDNLSDNLNALDGKALRGRTIKIEYFSEKRNSLKSCNVLYLAHSTPQKTQHILELIRSNSILTISEMPNFINLGGMIKLQTQNDKIRFTINLMATRAAGLEISARLLNLATVINEEAP
ncbi:MAG: YfiR family protein [Candidatus Thiodiazotropha sp. 6PLUC2]